ncbi:MAG: hypothetical protein BWY66_01641 [bacterium ADurb.Bin374]|nr:MAG: hypothetical protein BWY66_01641 [bacterium ADurb.Bin374]
MTYRLKILSFLYNLGADGSSDSRIERIGLRGSMSSFTAAAAANACSCVSAAMRATGSPWNFTNSEARNGWSSRTRGFTFRPGMSATVKTR